MTATEQRIIGLLCQHPTRRISYDQIAQAIDRETRTVATAIARLRTAGKLQIDEPGKGRLPNRYNVLV